jgi:glycosyltransferase involved in cell wall biosynthesis
MDLISVIIPTYNRFSFLLNTIKSVLNQTYKNIEIIVVNDASTQQEYYTYNWNQEFPGVKIINLEKNSKQKIGYACAAHVRNQGISISKGKYIAFCDDDDIWFPNKLELQIKAMNELSCKMSSTDGLIGNGCFDINKKYHVYNNEHYYQTLVNIYKNKNSNLLDNGIPDIFTLELIKIHNLIICSSVIIEKEILDKINNFKLVKNSQEDWDCWIRALEHTNCAYVKDICFYYDNSHGAGQNY